MLRLLVGITPQTTAGALLQQTHPTPLVSGPDVARYTAQQRERGRYLVSTAPQLHQGPSTLQSIPGLPLILIIGQDYRYTAGSVKQPHVGATVQQTHPVPPVSGPERAGYTARHVNRYLVPAPIYVHQGATSQVTFPVPVTEQPPDRWYVLGLPNPRYLVGVAPRLDSVVVAADTIPPFTTTQPDGARLVLRQSPRSRQDVATGHVHQGPLAQDWFLYPTNEPDPLRYDQPKQAWRALASPPARTEGALSQQTFPIPPVTTRADAWFGWPAATFADINRRLTGPRPQVDGALVQQTYEFTPNQPERGRFERLAQALRTITMPAFRSEGATVQDWFLYPVNEPEAWSWLKPQALRYITAAIPRFEGAGAVAPQTYEFLLGQPDQTRYQLPVQAWRWGIAPPVRVEGASIQQTHPVAGVTTRPDDWWIPDLTRRQPTATRPIDVVTSADVFGTSPSAIAWSLRLQDLRYRAHTFVLDVTARQTDTFGLAPDLAAHRRGSPERYRVTVAPRVDGAISQATFPIPPAGGPPSGWFEQRSTTAREARRRTGWTWLIDDALSFLPLVRLATTRSHSLLRTVVLALARRVSSRSPTRDTEYLP